MSVIPTKEEALELLKEHNSEPFLIRHGEIVAGVMGYFAKEYDPERVEFWEVVGLLHDIDFERYPEEHCVKAEELLKEKNIHPDIIKSVCSHGYGCTGTKYEPESMMEKILFATDELTGIIGAAALLRPSKSIDDMKLKSVKKKFKDKSFAAGCSRETIQTGAQMLGWEIDELLQRTLDAMKSLNPDMGL